MDWISDSFQQLSQIDWKLEDLSFPLFEGFNPFKQEQDFIVAVMFIVVIICVIIAQPKS